MRPLVVGLSFFLVATPACFHPNELGRIFRWSAAGPGCRPAPGLLSLRILLVTFCARLAFFIRAVLSCRRTKRGEDQHGEKTATPPGFAIAGNGQRPAHFHREKQRWQCRCSVPKITVTFITLHRADLRKLSLRRIQEWLMSRPDVTIRKNQKFSQKQKSSSSARIPPSPGAGRTQPIVAVKLPRTTLVVCDRRHMLLRTMAVVLRAQLRMSWSAIFRSALRTFATAK